MVTTRNQDSKQNHQEGDSAAVLAELRRELETMRKMDEEDRERHAGVLN